MHVCVRERTQCAFTQTCPPADLVCACGTASACTRWPARLFDNVFAAHVRVCSTRTSHPARISPAVLSLLQAGRRLPARLSSQCTPSCFYRNRGSAPTPPAEASVGACPVEAASLAQVWVSSKWLGGLRRNPNALNQESLCAVGGGGAAAWPGDPAREPWAGTMLACLTRGNLLDVLPEGFNEVTICSSHSPVPLPQCFPPNLWKGSSSTPILTRTVEQFACRALRGLRWWMPCRETGGVREVKRASFHQPSWALTFSGSLPEPRRQDHIFRGYLFQKRLSLLSPGDSPQGNS